MSNKSPLITVMQTEINLPFITADTSGPKHLNYTLTRAKLEQLTADLVEQSMLPVQAALEDARLKPENVDEVVLVGGMTRMPAVQQAVRELFGREPHKKVNPDEVVAVGAAIQAGVLGGDVTDVLLLDVTPLTLSIETLGGVSTALIERNTTIPTSKSQVFSTASDMQSSVEINVLQGERQMATDNKSLGKFVLDGIPPAPRGVPQIEVTFDLDSDGILNVAAQDKATNRSQNITIQGSSGLSEDEIESMVSAAREHHDEDRQRKERIEVINAGDTATYSAERALKDLGEQADPEIKAGVEDALDALRKTLAGEDLEAIRAATNTLQQEIQRIGEDAHQQQQDSEADVNTQDSKADLDPDGQEEEPDQEIFEGEFKEE